MKYKMVDIFAIILFSPTSNVESKKHRSTKLAVLISLFSLLLSEVEI